MLAAAGTGCVKDKITGKPSPIVSLDDVRLLYTDKEVTLTSENMLGASSITGVIISDQAGGNAPEGLAILQSYRRRQLRGIALNMGADAANYTAGDSVIVNITGKVLSRVNGILQIAGVSAADITKIEADRPQMINLVTSTVTAITNKMNEYECTLVQLKSAVADESDFGKTFEGDRIITDWASPIIFHTQPAAAFAATTIPDMGDYTGIALFHTIDGEARPTIWMRNAGDIVQLDLEPRHPGELYRNFPEGWENRSTAHISAYNASGTDVFPSGEWLFPRMYTISSSNVANKIGTWALMMQASQAVGLTMNFNLPYGASKFSFYCGPATATDTNLPIEVLAEYSQDSGESWKPLGDPILLTTFKRYYQEYELDIKGPIRFRISQNGAPARTFVDEVAVYQN